MTMLFKPVMFRPLPRPVRPFPNETLSSYWGRLGAANHVPVEHVRLLSPWHGSLTSDTTKRTDELEILSGQRERSLTLALPELRWNEQGFASLPERNSYLRQWACRLCAAAKFPGQPIQVWALAHHTQVCTRHGLWIGKAVSQPQDQRDLEQLPGTISAQLCHRRLLRRYGPDRISLAHRAARPFWRSLAGRYYTLAESDPTRLLQPRGSRTGWSPDLYATAYPAVVTVMAMSMTPCWRALLRDSMHTADVNHFLDEFFRRLPPDDPLHSDPHPYKIASMAGTVMRRVRRDLLRLPPGTRASSMS